MKKRDPAHPLAPLYVRDFRLLFTGFAVGQMLGPMQFLTQILWVQEYAPRDIWLILVAMIGACRGVGALTFGLYGGALADRFDRRNLLLAAQVLLLVTTLAIAALMLSGETNTLAFVVFFVLTFLSAGLQAIDAPTRLAIVPDILGPERTAAGMSLNQVAGQLSMPMALFGIGIIIDTVGFGGTYLLSTLGHLTIIVCVAMMTWNQEGNTGTSSAGTRYSTRQTFADIRDGITYARNQPVVMWVIILMIVMMGLGFPSTANLGPTWVTTVVDVEIRNVGYIMMTWGIGAIIGSLAMTYYASVERRGALIAGGALLFSASFLVFVIDTTVLNVVIGNFGLGIAMTTTMVSCTILIQHLVVNEMRGRVMSLLQLNMGFAQLMTMPIAALAQWLSLEVLMPLVATLTLVLVGLIVITHPEIARARVQQSASRPS